MKTLFWNVDTQYDFMRDDESFKGALAVPGARAIEPALERLTTFAHDHGIQVVNTADWHSLQSKELSATPDYVTTFPPHCLQHTKGAQFVEATAPKDPYIIDWQDRMFNQVALARHRGDIVLYKDHFDIFRGSPHADGVLEVVNPDRVVVYGVATNVCVDYAVRGLLERGKAVIVTSDAIKELPNLPLPFAAWRGASLMTVDEIVRRLESDSAGEG